MIPLRLYLGLGFIAACAALSVYVSHLRDSLGEARLEAAAATMLVSQLEDTRAADQVATTGLQKATVRTLTVTKEIVREVPVLVPAGSCQLPAGWRVLHDAAAAGVLPVASSPADGSPVDPQSAAVTVAENYGTCQRTTAQLQELQQWLINTRPQAAPPR